MPDCLFSALFEDSAQWQVFASGQAEGVLSCSAAPDGTHGLRLDYDFHGGGGFVAIRRPLAFKLPTTFEIGFLLRGEGLANNLEFKVSSPGGADVWRHVCKAFTPPESWRSHRIRERDLPFAWGPAGGGAPSEIEAVECVIAAGPGGKGTLHFATPSFEDQTLQTPAAVRASSQQPGCSPESVFAEDSRSEWRATAADAHPWWAVDFGKSQRFGGLVIQWPEPLPPRAFKVELSDDAHVWRSLCQATSARGPRTHIPAPNAEARYLRITFEKAACAALRSIALRPDAFSHTPNEFIHSVAADFPRGWFPRYWLREQSYWTPVGSPAGKRRALINEEGLVETDEAGFSLEPFILTPKRTVTWADVKASPSLYHGGLPVPSVMWTADRIRLNIAPWVDGKNDALTLHVTYRLEGHELTPGTRLVIAVRPFQVNPPWQAFRNLGGRSPIHQILCNATGLTVAGREVSVAPHADAQGASAFEEGEAPSVLTNGELPLSQHVDDPSGLASAEMAWNLPEGKSILEVTVSVPFFERNGTFTVSETHVEAGTLLFPSSSGSKDTPALASRHACPAPQTGTGVSPLPINARADAVARWRRKLGAVKWRVPACAAPAFDCFRTAAGHILINRDGPALQPGPRRYTRSWVRDCVIMGAALAKAGLPEALRTFLNWYAPFQRTDGFIPCVVDRDGIDWLVEHDSHGQFLWGVREVYRDSGNRTFLNHMLPHVRKAADCLIALRAERMTAPYRSGAQAACFGLLPESASHEGYLAHPVHSYWDDFWGIRGLEASADLAETAGLAEDAQRWRSEAARFQSDVLRSIGKVIADKQLAYIPGSVEWADFDPTATSNAIAMLDFADALPQAPLHAMLATYLDGFRRKQRGAMPWNNYTAYEIRIIGAFVRLGKRECANELLSFFLSDRRPCEWNQWPEITWRDPRSPGHLGDVPHTWIAAEYVLALASMVAAEREATNALVLASGMPWAWISEEAGFSVSGLPTRYGTLDFMIHANSEEALQVSIGDAITLPPGGLTLVPPLPAGRRIIAVETQQAGQASVDLLGRTVAVTRLPFAAVLRLGQPA